MQLIKYFHELSLHPKNAKELKGLILQLAVQGKLTRDFRLCHPELREGPHSASALLDQIKAEKKQLIKEKKIKKEKPLPAISPEEIPFDLPEGWVWCRLNDIGIIGSSMRVHQSDWREDGVPFYRAREIVKLSKYGKVDNELFISNDHFEKVRHNSLVPEVNDIMLTGVGTIGVPYVVQSGEKFYYKDASVLIFKNLFSFYPYYLELFFRSLYWSEAIHKESMGTTVHTLTISRAKFIPFILPSILEQEAIVETVNQLFKEVEQLEQLTVERIQLKEQFATSALNQLASNNTAREWAFVQEHFHPFFNHQPNIKKLRETILQLAVQGKLTSDFRASHPGLCTGSNSASALLDQIKAEKVRLVKEKKIKKENPLPAITPEEIPYELPEGWVWCRFHNVFDIRDGTHDSPKNIDGDGSFPLVTSKDFKNGKIDFSNAKRISKHDYIKIIQRSFVEKDDILFSMIGGNIGNQVVVESFTDFAIKNVALFKYINKEVSLPDFLKIYSRHIAYTLQYQAVGGAQPFVSLTNLRNLLFPFPPIAEQKAIVETVNRLMTLCDQLEQEVQLGEVLMEQWMKGVLREVLGV